MVKGVNKQIIEINYTQDDYIQKAILFVNPSKCDTNSTVLKSKATSYMEEILKQDNSKKIASKSPKIQKKMMSGIIKLCLSGVFGAIIAYLLINIL